MLMARGHKLWTWTARTWRWFKRWVEGKGAMGNPDAVVDKARNRTTTIFLVAVAAILVLGLLNLPSASVAGVTGWLVVGTIRTMIAIFVVAAILRQVRVLRRAEIAAGLFIVVWIFLWIEMRRS